MSGIAFLDQAGPASYATGGFSVATGLTSVTSCQVKVKTRGANLGFADFDVSYSGGNVTIKVMRNNFDRVTTIGGVIGLDASLTGGVKASSGQSYDTSTHLHSIDHDHPATTSSGPSNSGVATLAVAAQPNALTHTHSVDLPNFVANSVSETAHTHTWNNIYDHSHSITNTSTNMTATELANTTDLSGTTLTLHAIGTV